MGARRAQIPEQRDKKTNICKPILSPRAERMCQIGKQSGEVGLLWGTQKGQATCLNYGLLSRFGSPGNFKKILTINACREGHFISRGCTPNSSRALQLLPKQFLYLSFLPGSESPAVIKNRISDILGHTVAL